MRPGARTPEEFETLFEDTSAVRDREALAPLHGGCCGRATPPFSSDAAIALMTTGRARPGCESAATVRARGGLSQCFANDRPAFRWPHLDHEEAMSHQPTRKTALT